MNNIKTTENIKKLIENDNIRELLITFSSNPEFEIITICKKNLFFIDKTGKNIYKKFISILKQNLIEYDNYLNYLKEVEIINKVFKNFRKHTIKMNQFNARYMLGYFLTKMDELIAESRKKINFDDSNTIEQHEMNVNNYNKIFKSLCDNTKLYDKEFKHKPYSFLEKINYKLDSKSLVYFIYQQLSLNWFNNFTLNYWKAGFNSLSMEKNQVYITLIKSKEIIDHYSLYVKQDYINQLKSYKYTEKNPIFKDYNSAIYSNSTGIIESSLFGDINEIKIDGITMKNWLNAYYSLAIISRDFKMRKFLKKGWSKEMWLDHMIKHGVDPRVVDELFSLLQFNENSIDLYDCPFIKVKNKYYIPFEIMADAEPGKAIVSRIKTEKGYNEKGTNFENYIKGKLRLLNIPNVNVSTNINMDLKNKKKEKYECDIIFYFENTIFFCECKSRKQYDFCEFNRNDVQEDIKQLKRIRDFYIDNMQYVIAEFKRNGININLNEIKGYKSIVLYSRTMDGIVEEDNIIAMDFYKFFIPLESNNILRKIGISELVKIKNKVDRMYTYYYDNHFEKIYKSEIIIPDDFNEELPIGKLIIKNQRIIENKHSYKHNNEQSKHFISLLHNRGLFWDLL